MFFFGNVINDRIKDRNIDTSVGTLDISLGTLRNCIHAFVDRNKMVLVAYGDLHLQETLTNYITYRSSYITSSMEVHKKQFITA